ncbi:unnamed protein product, partial [Mesorhabditis belari]|uniref:7TM GPCR serpentine receptor class x (Srx) domain-containing protein n=1 Tax=Mesorhabditis belari TaxID=2138241 RepID=A0AAF3J9C9_9BILA
MLVMRADCRLYYYEPIWTYTFSNTTACGVIGWYYDFLKSMTTIIIIVILDLFTFTKCRIHGAHLIAQLSDEKSRARKRDEINFVTQASLQGFIFILELVTYFVVSSLVDARAAKFAFTTLAWILVHALDGVIAIYFNKEFSRLIRRRHISASTQNQLTASQSGQRSEQSTKANTNKKNVYSTS